MCLSGNYRRGSCIRCSSSSDILFSCKPKACTLTLVDSDGNILVKRFEVVEE